MRGIPPDARAPRARRGRLGRLGAQSLPAARRGSRAPASSQPQHVSRCRCPAGGCVYPESQAAPADPPASMTRVVEPRRAERRSASLPSATTAPALHRDRASHAAAPDPECGPSAFRMTRSARWPCVRMLLALSHERRARQPNACAETLARIVLATQRTARRSSSAESPLHLGGPPEPPTLRQRSRELDALRDAPRVGLRDRSRPSPTPASAARLRGRSLIVADDDRSASGVAFQRRSSSKMPSGSRLRQGPTRGPPRSTRSEELGLSPLTSSVTMASCSLLRVRMPRRTPASL